MPGRPPWIKRKSKRGKEKEEKSPKEKIEKKGSGLALRGGGRAFYKGGKV